MSDAPKEVGLWVQKADGQWVKLGGVSDFVVGVPTPIDPLNAYVDRADCERYLLGTNPIVSPPPGDLRDSLTEEFGV